MRADSSLYALSLNRRGLHLCPHTHPPAGPMSPKLHVDPATASGHNPIPQHKSPGEVGEEYKKTIGGPTSTMRIPQGCGKQNEWDQLNQ